MTRYFKCIKNFWMYGESVETGDIPAFAEGVTYEAEGEGETLLFTSDNQGSEHYMDIVTVEGDDYNFFDYFVEVAADD